MRHRAPELLRQIAAIPGAPLLVLRAFLGVTFTFAGLEKLANRGFFESNVAGSFQAQLAGAARTSPIAGLLHLVEHAPVPIAVSIAIGELAVGLGTLLGLFARVAAVAGMLLALSFFLTISWSDSPYYYGADIVFVFAWTPIVLGGSPIISLDAALARRDARDELAAIDAGRTDARGAAGLERRALLRRGATAGLTAVGVGVLGGLDALIGRSNPTKSTIGSDTTPTATAPSSSGAATGRPIATVAEVPVGGALAFTDPTQEIPAYVLQPTSGTFLAFSAICTHAGCTVNFDRSAEEFVCPCHGSIYDARTGAVIQGPAPRPLPSIGIRESGGSLYATD